MAPAALNEDYWENFQLQSEDIEFLYNYLLETETPLTTSELVDLLVDERIRREKLALEQERSSGGDVYFPKDRYQTDQKLIFPALSWRRGKVVGLRSGCNPDIGEFDVVRVAFENGEEREYAANLAHHALNQPVAYPEEETSLDASHVLATFREELIDNLEQDLPNHQDFVQIAGRWFPRALLVDINIGHLNLAEAVLDMASGGPLSTTALLEQIGVSSNVNAKLLEFSMDLALQEDERFDEVGATGQVLWFLHRLEPEPVREPPLFLRYSGIEYDRAQLSAEMLALEQELDDELSPLGGKFTHLNEVQVRLIYSHWRAGTLPLSARLRHLFPTAYEAPRIRFTLVDGETHEQIPAWVVRPKRYVYGLEEWYKKNNLIPGSVLRIQRGERPGEVILHSGARRPSREWIRTVLVGSDGGVVFAMLKQTVQSIFDERMAIVVPDVNGLDEVWQQLNKDRTPFERVVMNLVRELAKLNPQGHVHASELYAALNVVRRCPPGPMLALLASRPVFTHVGDLHFRYNEPERAA